MNKTNITQVAKYTFIVFLATILLASCRTTPFTGRRQMLLVPNSTVLQMSLQQYNYFMSTANVITGTEDAEMVQRVGSRIATAVETFYRNNGMEAELRNFNWSFSLVENPSVNAFAMPGGKIVIYTGLLPVTQTEEALAVVVGHEIAHVIAHHASERISQQLMLQGVTGIGRAALGNTQRAQIGAAVFGLGAQAFVMLPFSRQQEHEADEIGLVIMALAGYDPRAAVPFWTRMMEMGSGGHPLPFLSTHPSDAARIAHIESIMPHALSFYKGAGIQNTTTEPISTSVNIPQSDNVATSPEWSF